MRFATTLASLLFVGALSADATESKKDVAFAERSHQKLRLDLDYPDAPAPKAGYPLIISIHGGGWTAGDRKKDFFLRDFTRDGYAVASIDYRLADAAPFPAQIDDCREALRWILDHSADYQIDPNRIGLTGASAGGHLALLLGLSETHRFAAGGTAPLPKHTIKAICAFYPVTDLVAIVPAARRDRTDNVIAKLLGGSVAQKSELAKEGSPMTYIVADAPPTLLIHGDRDQIVPLRQSETFVAAARKAGAESRLIVYAGAGHAFGPKPETREEILAFFNRCLRP